MMLLSIVVVLCSLCGLVTGASAQEPPAPTAISATQLRAAIDKLSDLDYATRMKAAQTIRRAETNPAVQALLQAVAEHGDGYVRYRALVLLTGFNDPRTRDAMRESLKSPNDRLRAVAYSYFEHNPDRGMTSELLAALEKEQAEFVRPTLEKYEHESSCYYASARIWDDGVIDPLDTRATLALGIAASLNAGIPEAPPFGVFRM